MTKADSESVASVSRRDNGSEWFLLTENNTTTPFVTLAVTDTGRAWRTLILQGRRLLRGWAGRMATMEGG